MPPNPAPGINPVALTYTPPPNTGTNTTPPPNPSGSTANSIPHPEPISSSTYHIAGLLTTVFGLSELPPSCSEVAVLWLLHPRLQTQACMAPFAAHIITSWNTHTPQRSHRSNKKGLIAVSFDQRNHGSREVSAIANEAWRGGNDRHAQDMFSCYQGTAMDTSQLIDYLSAYIFPRDERTIVQHMVLGISLGGHAAWQCVMQDSRIGAAVVTIGCPDYARLMSDRARLSKRKSWVEGEGRGFVGCEDFPRALVEAVRRNDPAGVVWGGLDRGVGKECIYEGLSEEEKAKLMPLMKRCFGNKTIMCLSGGSDKLVPYKMGEPFMEWLKKSIGKGGFFEAGGLYLEDIVLPGVGHDVPPAMVEHMIRFFVETLDSEPAQDATVKRRSSRESRI